MRTKWVPHNPPWKKKKKMTDTSKKQYVSTRVKVKTVPYEPNVTIGSNKRRSTGSVETNDHLFQRNAFLAVRNDEDGFYICRTLQHIYEKTQRFSILWLEQDAQDSSAYNVAYNDQLDADCILTDVRMRRVDKNKYFLTENQKKRIEEVLSHSINPNASSEDEETNEESEEEEEEPPKKRRKVDASAKKGPTKKRKPAEKPAKGKLKKTNSASAVAAAKVIKKRALNKTTATGKKKGSDSNTGKAKAIKAGGKKKGALVPRGSIKVLEKDPFLDSKEKVPFISTLAQSKLALRAANQNDIKLLKELIDDRSHVAKLNIVHSLDSEVTALEVALKKENMAFTQLLCKHLFPKEESIKKLPRRVALTTSLLKSESTGRYNRVSLHGVRFIRKLNMSRGSREGNNAFTKDLELYGAGDNWSEALISAIESGVSKATLDKFCAMTDNPTVAKDECYDNISLAVQMGHRKLAAALMDDVAKTGLSNFNFLHHDVLEFDNQELRTGIRDISVKKRPFNNDKITPLHCAAINPNRKYLSKLLDIHPDCNILDSKRRRLTHFAVACEGTGPLQVLIENNVSLTEVDGDGLTPLFTACIAGRQHNVELLLKHTQNEENKKSKEKVDGEEAPTLEKKNKFGICGINMPASKPSYRWFSYTPLHITANLGYTEIAETLISYGADINKELNASKNKLTPLMIAASCGHIEMVRLLIKHGAKVSQKDKIKRTPMMLAAMNGYAHVISLFLSLGCSADDQDSSGNTALHYAAGYGWYFCVKILLDSKADPNIANDWKTTPLGIAFLKGHIGLADVLLEQPSVDINFRLDGGLTLVHTACSSALIEGIVEQLEYLVVKKSADCTLVDDTGGNALHHLSKNNIKLNYVHSYNSFQACDVAMDRSVKMAEMLIQHGCDISTKDEDERTPLMLAVEQGNQKLIEFLVKNGAGVSVSVDKAQRNILHFLSEQCMTQPMSEILMMLKKSTNDAGIFVEMAKQTDSDGMTPLIRACFQYRFWNGVFKSNVVSPYEMASYSMTPKSMSGAVITTATNNVAKDKSDNGKEKVDGDDDEEEEEKEEDDEEDEEKDSDDEKSDECDDQEEPDKDEEEMEVQEDGTKDSPEQQNQTAPVLSLTQRQAAQWLEGRRYISELLKLCRACADIPLQKKQFPAYAVIPEKEEEQYIHTSMAGFTAVHFLATVEHEFQSTVDESNVTVATPCPALSEFLKCLRNKSVAKVYNLFGRSPLLLALAEKQQSAAQILLEFGVDVNARSTNKETDGLGSPLVLAAKNGLHDLIPLLLKHGANVNDKDANTQCSALHYVIKSPVSSCFKQTVESLLAHKARTTEVDKYQKTALHLLVEHARGMIESVSIADLLLKAGAAIDACDRKGRTPLHLTVNANSGDANCSVEMEQFLLDKGANQFARDWLQRLPLHFVFVKIGKHTNVSPIDPMELCSTLTASTNKPGSMVSYGDQFGLTPLHVAARRGAAVCCIHLIKKGANVNSRDFDGNTALSLAVLNKHESCTILLLQNNGDISGDINIIPPPPPLPKEVVETGDDTSGKKKKEKPEWKWQHLKTAEKIPETQKYSIFQGAIANEWQGVIFLMLDLLEKFKISMTNMVHAAFMTRKYHLSLSLIRKAKDKKELSARLENNQNLAHILAKSSFTSGEYHDHMIYTVAGLLFDKGISFDLEDEFGCTPMHYACLQGNVPLVNYILANYKDIDLDKKDKFGRTAMAATFWKFNQSHDIVTKISRLLHDRGASLDLLCPFPCKDVYKYGHKRTFEVEDYIRSTASHQPISPLMLAIINHDFDLARHLMVLGASRNFPDLEGRTPLMLAVQENDLHLVRIILHFAYQKHHGNADEVAMEAVNIKIRHQSRNAFTLGRKLQKLPSINKNTFKDQATGKTSNVIVVNGLNMSATMYPKSSDVNMTALDCRGRSVLHYLVRQPPDGSFDNYQLLQQLVSVGAPLQQADKDGKTILDYARANGLSKLTTTIQYLMDKGKVAFEIPQYASTTVTDGITWNTANPDFVNDSTKFIDKFEQDVQAEEGKTDAEFKAVPDQHMSESTTGQVFIDNDLNLPYDILMTKIDVATGNWGLYNFYKMQIVYQKGKDLYILFTRWGRIGDTGQFQQTPFPRQADAVKEFCKIFRSKSGNEWKNVKSFAPVPRKYRLVPWEQRDFGRKAIDITVDLTSNLPSKLHPYVKDMISEITDMAMLTSSMDKLGIDRSLVPLGRIRKEVLIKARDILLELKKLVKSLDDMRSKITTTDMEKYAQELEGVAKLSNDYYHLLPKQGFEYERIPILDQNHLLEHEWKNIEVLMELEIATKIIIGAQYSNKAMNPMDYIYRCLECQIQLMNESEIEAQYLLRYASATWSGKIEAIYRIARKDEDQRLESCGIDNHRLLFHGSSSSNLISILSKGLLISPPDAPGCGSAFGNGIYTADRFSKSLGYCFNYGQHSKVKYMLVCEVALGRTKDIYTYEYQEKCPDGFQSVRGVGQNQPDPLFDLTLPTGTVIPLGDNKYRRNVGSDQYLSLHDSEYIIYKEDQLCLRYIIQFIS